MDGAGRDHPRRAVTEATHGRPSVLLLAGAVRQEWTRVLEAAGIEVRTTGWLDGITAARLRRPDAVLVSADLPENAPVTLVVAFRSAVDLHRIPLVVAGLAPDVAEAQREHPLHADRYVPAPVGHEHLARDVGEAIAAGRLPWRRPREQVVVLALVGFGALALLGRIIADAISYRDDGASAVAPRAADALLAAGVGAMTAAMAYGIAKLPRPLTVRRRRTIAGWTGIVLWQVAALAGQRTRAAEAMVYAVACLAWAEWARLGLRITPPPGTAKRRWYVLLGGALVVLAVGWLAFAASAR